MASYDYCTIEQVKAELSIGSGQAFVSTYDSILSNMVAEVSRMIDRYKKVPAGAYKTEDQQSDVTSYYHGSGGISQQISPHASITSVAVEETDGTYTAWSSGTDYFEFPDNYAALGEPIVRLDCNLKSSGAKRRWTYGQRRVKVIGALGISASVPDEVRRATVTQVSRWYNRAIAGWSDGGAVQDLGQMRYTKKMDPEVEDILRRVYPHRGNISL